MRTFPIIRDLVTDVSFNYTMARQVPPLGPAPPEADGTYRMQQIDVERGQEFRKCIECFMCQNVCHVIRDHEENKAHFAGPRLFIRYMELESHPLDTNDRRELLRERMGIGMCNITKCCTEVCPEHIKITDNAIIPLKERVVDASYDPVAWLGRKILRRTKRTAVEAADDAPWVAAPTSADGMTPTPTAGSSPPTSSPATGVAARELRLSLVGGLRGRRPRRRGPRGGRSGPREPENGEKSQSRRLGPGDTCGGPE